MSNYKNTRVVTAAVLFLALSAAAVPSVASATHHTRDARLRLLLPESWTRPATHDHRPTATRPSAPPAPNPVAPPPARNPVSPPSKTSPPVNTSPPSISGVPVAGKTLVASPGAWSSSETPTYAFEWRRCDAGGAGCARIPAASASSYVLAPIDVGSTVRVAVTATLRGASASAVSAATPRVTAPLPPPVAPPTPPLSGQWFSASSPLNTPITAGAGVDANSTAMVQGLAAAVQEKGWHIAVKRWTVPVYYADGSTPRRNIPLTASWRAASTIYNVPVPADARPDPGGTSDTDGHMAIIDRSTGCFYEFYEAMRRADGSWEAKWANRGLMSGTGIQPGGWSTRASGFVNFAGLIRPEELQVGVINHALTFAYPYTKAGGPVLPATSSDGRPASESGQATGSSPLPSTALPIPEGARIQLDPRLNLNVLGLQPWQKIVARALQVYGMYLTDTGGGLGMGAQNPQSYSSNPYVPFWGDGNYAYLPPSLTKHLRVLTLGPQYQPSGYIAPSPCGGLK